MVIDVPTRQVPTGTQWVDDWNTGYYKLEEASTVESMSNSISIDLTYVGERDSEEVPFNSLISNYVIFSKDNWVQSESNSNEYTNTYTFDEYGIEAYKDCTVLSNPLPSGIIKVVCSPTGEEESNTATITAYSNSILDTTLVTARVQVKPVISIYAGSGNISVMPQYENLSIVLPNEDLIIFEQVNNANNIYINAGYYYNERTSTPTIESPVTVTANYGYTAVYSTAKGTLGFDNQIANVNVRTPPNVGTLDEYGATAYSIHYTIRGTEDDIGKQGRVEFSYSQLQPTYTTYANVRFTGPCANGAWANDALVNYINFNGKRYP